MALLFLRQEELEVLSLVNGKRTNDFSVFYKMEGFDKDSFEDKRKMHIDVINDFLKDGAMWRSEDGKVHLIRELQAVFNILNAPEKTMKIKTASSQPIGEHYYSMIGEKGVLFSIGKEGEFYSVGYPFDDYLISTWLKNEIIGQFKAEEKSTEELKCTLTGDEFNLLSMILMHNRYGRVKGSKGVKIKDIKKKDISREIDAVNFVKIKPETVNKIISDENFHEIIEKLSGKGILSVEKDYVKLNELIVKSFDPESLKDVVEVSELGPFMRAKNLYVTSCGYMTVEPVASSQGNWNIEIIGLDTPPYKLYQKIKEFSPFEISRGFAEEINKHIKV